MIAVCAHVCVCVYLWATFDEETKKAALVRLYLSSDLEEMGDGPIQVSGYPG